MIGLIIMLIIALAVAAMYAKRKKRIQEYILPANAKQLLTDNIPFYNKLDSAGKALFEERIRDFLATTTIRGIDVEVEDLDRILIASGAIILIFSFPDWKYNNLSEVLLYKGTFNKEFATDGEDVNVLGMVGEGALHREMILSRPSLRASFNNPVDGHNTVLHEFAHLIDKADGEVDGIPEYLLARPDIAAWGQLVHKTIAEMKTGRSDIDYYGTTNEAEFFAVISEYFFEQPDKLENNHPELYALLSGMFHPKASDKK